MSATLIRWLLIPVAHLPFAWVQRLGGALGRLAARLPNAHRRITARNLELCFPKLTMAEREQLMRRSLIESGKTVTETIALWLGPVQRSLQLVREARGEEILDAAIEAARGVILVSPHLGSWEMVGLYAGQRYPIVSMYRSPRQKSFDAIIREARQRTGAHLVPADGRGIKSMFQALQQGGIVGILPDQDPHGGGGAVFAPFFDMQANTMTLVSRLASKTGAAVIFIFAERLPTGGGFRLHVMQAPPGIADPDPVRAATALNAGVEACVRKVPEQYQWSYKRFRSRPAGESRLY